MKTPKHRETKENPDKANLDFEEFLENILKVKLPEKKKPVKKEKSKPKK